MNRIGIGLFVFGTAVLLPLAARATSYTAGTYYVGVEDTSTPCGARNGSDCDYNDLIFTMSGLGLTAFSSGVLYNPVHPSNDGTPFWDHRSSDSAHSNFGNCLYSSGARNTCTPSGASADPLSPTAQFLASAGSREASVAFHFSSLSTVSVSLVTALSAQPDRDDLYWCAAGASLMGGLASSCHQIGINGTNNQTTFSPGGAFDLVLFNRAVGRGGRGGIGPYDSDPTVAGGLNPSIDHFALALDDSGPGASSGSGNDPVNDPATIPEPAAFSLVGLGFAALAGLVRLRRV
jgi:hypothetical protein